MSIDRLKAEVKSKEALILTKKINAIIDQVNFLSNTMNTVLGVTKSLLKELQKMRVEEDGIRRKRQ